MAKLAGLGAFAGGLASGIAAGQRIANDSERSKQGKELHDLRIKEAELGLEMGKGRAEDMRRERDYRLGRENIIKDLLVPGDDQEETGQGMPLSRLTNLHERLAQYDFQHGRMDQKTFMAMPQAIQQMQDSGMFDAYRHFVETGDAAGMAERVNRVGRIKVDPKSIQLEKLADQVTGVPYNAIRYTTEDGQVGTFDPLKAAQFVGGSKGYREWHDKRARHVAEGRRAAASERQAAAAERRADSQERSAGARDQINQARLELASLRENRRGQQGSLTSPQIRQNEEIDAARKIISNLSPEEIRKRTSKFTNTGRENPDYDPTMERRLRLANTRKYGDDTDFNANTEAASTPGAGPIERRFGSDPQMRGHRLGKQTDRGHEVLDKNNKLIGYYR